MRARAILLGIHFGCACGIWMMWFAPAQAAVSNIDPRGGQFIGLSRFGGFEKTQGERPREVVLTSPVLLPRINFDELIVSWNVDLPEGTYLRLEARGLYPSGPTKYYVMGLWSNDPARHPRESVPGQKDDDGNVATDTLKLNRAADRFQVRVILGSDTIDRPRLKFLGLSLTDTKASPPRLAPNRTAWDALIPVPERSQMMYPNGRVLCSPTTLSMLMAYWAEKLKQPGLDHDVPQIAAAIYDAKWKGTGNWVFNTAFAGSGRGLRAYVTRMSDISELEDWIADGIPVGLSLCYDRLRGKGPGPNGHLVVCVGFTPEGDPIINDPGTSKNVRKVFPRKNLADAWAYSRNAVYLVYPEGASVPQDRFGHWDSWTAHQRIRSE